MKLEDLANKEFEVTPDGFLKVVEKKGKFVQKVEETYWYVRSNGDVDYYNFINDEIDKYLLNHHPVFRTEEKAYEYKDYLELLDKYKYNFSDEEWRDDKTRKWYIWLNTDGGSLNINFNYINKHPNCIYFRTKENADNFIKEVGEENVKRFMFDVWE